MIDMALAVSVLEVQPVKPWQASVWHWKVSVIQTGKRVFIEGTAETSGDARKAAAYQCASFVGFNVSSAGVES